MTLNSCNTTSVMYLLFDLFVTRSGFLWWGDILG